MKSLDANVTTELDAQGRKSVLLFELALTGLTLRYAAYKTSIVFPHGGATTYTAKAIMFSGVSQSLEGQIGRVTVKFDNVAKDMATYADSYDFEGRMLTIKRIFLDADNHAPAASTEYIEVFPGKMELPKEIGRQWLIVTATEGKPLNKKVLNDAYVKECRHRFGSTQCNKDGYANLAVLTASGTADSGTVTTLVDNALTQIDDYWNYGKISITKGGVTYLRKVKDFDAATDKITFDVLLPVAVDNTTTYTVYKGCPKTWDACKSIHAYGPTTDNKNNFGGFIHIGLWKEE
jgi:hypothetical protein